MLRIDRLQVSYGGIQAVKDISLEVPEGKIVIVFKGSGEVEEIL